MKKFASFIPLLCLVFSIFSCQKKYTASFCQTASSLSPGKSSGIYSQSTPGNTPYHIKPGSSRITSQPSEDAYFSSLPESGRLKKETVPDFREIKRAESDVPFNFKKYSNAFWKIGGVLLILGLGLIILSLTLALKIARGDGSLFLWAILIGLGLTVISLPFILIGLIIGSAGKNKTAPQQNQF